MSALESNARASSAVASTALAQLEKLAVRIAHTPHKLDPNGIMYQGGAERETRCRQYEGGILEQVFKCLLRRNGRRALAVRAADMGRASNTPLKGVGVLPKQGLYAERRPLSNGPSHGRGRTCFFLRLLNFTQKPILINRYAHPGKYSLLDR